MDARMMEMEKDFHFIDTLAPEFNLQDAEGEPVHLSDFSDKIVLLNFINKNCTEICQLHSKKIAAIQASINDGPMKDLVQLISITTTPLSDTPHILSNYPEIYELDPVNWVFLTQTPSQPANAMQQLASDYTLNFTISDNSAMLKYTSAIHVIDIESRLAGTFHSVNFKNVNLILYVNELTNISQHRRRERG